MTSEQPIEDAASLLRGGLQQLPVMDHGTPVAVITRSDVAKCLAKAGPDTTVASAPTHAIILVTPSESLDGVLDKLGQKPDSVALVMDQGLPVGVLTAEHLAAHVALHSEDARRAA